MLSRAANNQKQAFTRYVRHGNLMNKRGVAATFQHSLRTQKLPYKTRRYHVSPTFVPVERKFGDMIVRPPAPKHVEEVAENRFTLPNTLMNANIYEQVMMRTQASFDDVLHELKSYQKIRAFAVDQDHDIEILV